MNVMYMLLYRRLGKSWKVLTFSSTLEHLEQEKNNWLANTPSWKHPDEWKTLVVEEI